MVDLSRFKVVYKDKVLKALALMGIEFKDSKKEDTYKEAKFIEILVINEDGNIEALQDEAWMFQFVPILEK